MKKLETLVVLLLTFAASYTLAEIALRISSSFIETGWIISFIVKIFFLYCGYKLVNTRYNFEKKGEGFFRDYKLFRK